MLIPETIKLLEETIGGKLHDIGLGNDFGEMKPKAQVTKIKTDNWTALKTAHQRIQLME